MSMLWHIVANSLLHSLSHNISIDKHLHHNSTLWHEI